MTEHTEGRVSHRELVLLAFVCGRCGGELTMDIRSREQAGRFVERDPVSELKCPFCAATFPPAFVASFRDFVAWRNKLEGSGQEIIFRLPCHPSEPPPVA